MEVQEAEALTYLEWLTQAFDKTDLFCPHNSYVR